MTGDSWGNRGREMSFQEERDLKIDAWVNLTLLLFLPAIIFTVEHFDETATLKDSVMIGITYLILCSVGHIRSHVEGVKNCIVNIYYKLEERLD